MICGDWGDGSFRRMILIVNIELICEARAHLRSPFPGERPWLLRMPIAICADGSDGCFRRMKLIVNIELIYGRCAHLRSPLPGIGESAGEEVTQSFDPLTSRGFTRVARGCYPSWGCSGFQ